MNHKEYNGWYNYETWATNLWLENDEGSYNYWIDAAQDACKQAERDRGDKSDATGALADRLKDEIDDAVPDLGCTLFADLMSAALSEINYYEIAEHMVEEQWEEDEEAA